jgi:hypothetical protein
MPVFWAVSGIVKTFVGKGPTVSELGWKSAVVCPAQIEKTEKLSKEMFRMSIIVGQKTKTFPC